MSEPDDKPNAGSAKRGDSSKSLFDSDWDALLGSSASASVSRPIFAPPKTAPLPISAGREPDPEPTKDVTPGDEIRPADPVPRSSEARASVSGAFLSPAPRPEPETPPRYEPPEGVTPEYDNADDVTADYLPILPPPGLAVGPSTEDDDELPAKDTQRNHELAQVIELSSKASAAEPQPRADRSGAGEAAAAKPRARPPEPVASPDLEPPAAGGSRKLSIAIGVIAAVVLIAVYVGRSRDEAEAPTTARDTQIDRAPATPPSNEPDLQPTPAIDHGTAGETDTGETGEGETDTGESETGEPSKLVPSEVDPRDPSVIPPGTPEENAKAFLKLPVSRLHDGPPIGGIGRSGIHLDAISTSRGRDNTDCDQPTDSFSLSVAKYVNVCFRVVHPREPEMVRVIWEKDGKITRRGRVRIPDLHAYTTRAYLLLRPEYVGQWRVRIVPEGEESVDLAVAEFEITE